MAGTNGRGAMGWTEAGDGGNWSEQVLEDWAELTSGLREVIGQPLPNTYKAASV